MYFSKVILLTAALLTRPAHIFAAPSSELELSRRADISVPLRLMPLGDSITKGSLSSKGNGWRGFLQENLEGVTFDFVGTQRNGNLNDRDHEGHSGKVLGEIRKNLEGGIGARPNVVLLHAGTNDMDLNRDVATAPDRLWDIVDYIFKRCPDATVIVAQIIESTKPEMQSRSNVYNKAIKDEAESRISDGQHIVRVDMSSLLDLSTDLADVKHPNDRGYRKMANAWYQGIQTANGKGWLKKPVKPEVTIGVGIGDNASGGDCAGDNWAKHLNAADLVRIWNDHGEMFGGYDGATLDNVILADVTGDGMADYLVVSKNGEVRGWKGTGEGFKAIGVIATGPKDVDGSKVRFADIDGDGLADYIVLYDDGAAKAWRNLGKVESTDDSQKWKELKPIAKGIHGVSGDKVTFADIDGDGLADYLVIYDGGAVEAYHNLGNMLSDKDENRWKSINGIALVNDVPGSKIRFADFNGDGLDDFLVLYDGGAVNLYQNNGRLLSDKSPKWNDMGTVATGVNGVTGKNVRFADIDGDGLDDYVVLSDNGAVHAYINSGKTHNGGAIRIADLNGDDRDDVIWVHKDGSADAWLNKGSGPWKWDSLGQIAKSPQGSSREKVQFADVNGDGLADYLIVHDGGAITSYRNNGNLNRNEEGSNWEGPEVISNGVGSEGRKLRFADMDGDSYDDLLVVFDGGSVDYYHNEGAGKGANTFKKTATIASGVGAPGSKIQFADIDGDGKDDYLVAWKGGAVEFYRNNGNLESDPNKRSWDNRGVIAAGVANQGLVLFGDFDGDGKDDYLSVHHETGVVDAYLNKCAWAGEDPNEGGGGGGGGDGGDWVPPSIPDGIFKEKFCSVIDENSQLTKTQKEWTDNDMDKQVEAYVTQFNPWPNDVQYSLLNYYNKEIFKFHCNPRSQCDFTIDHDVCADNPDLTFILLALTNFNNFLYDLKEGLLNAHQIVDGKTGKILTDFSPDTDPEADITTSVLGVTNGLLTMISAFFPPAGVAAGATGVASSILGWATAEDLEPKFDQYADITNNLADSVKTLIDAIEDFGDSVLIEKPELTGKKYIEDQFSITRILHDGVFAEEQPVDSIPDGVVGSMISPIINHLWSGRQVVIIKVDEDTIGGNPCPNNGGGIKGVSDDAIWCDHLDIAHVIIAWPEWIDTYSQKTYAQHFWVDGLNKLDDYDLDIEKIRGAADLSQERFGYTSDMDVSDKKELLLEGKLDTDRLLTFTFPVCDIRALNNDDEETRCGRFNVPSADDPFGPPRPIIFTYTSGRYLFNEDIRLKERHVEFNVDALKHLAARHIGRGKVSQLTKYAEGGFNRVFLLGMEDGSEAIAKIPYKIAVPAHYATASEAATLELLYLHGIPVPKVYGYSSTSDNEAGAEYLVMEKASGIGVKSKWLDMTKRERFTLASSFVEAENKFNKFCIGPTADYMFWLGSRSKLDIERGPWDKPADYLQAIAAKEILWTQKFGKPIELDFPHNGFVTGEQSPEQYIALLEKYLATTPHLLPKDPSNPWNQPILRHPDLNPNNVFISPVSGAVTCIIDWQHTIIEPRLLAAGYPRAFQGPDDEEPQDLKEPTLPQDYYTSLPTEEKTEADELYRRRLQFHYYRILNGSKNAAHVDALYEPLLNPRQHLIDRAGRQWSGNLMTLKDALVRMVKHWSQFPDVQGVKFPVEFSEDEVKDFESLEETWFGLNKLMEYWRGNIGVSSENGWVANGEYEDAIRKVEELRASLTKMADGDEEDLVLVRRGWAFRDREEIN